MAHCDMGAMEPFKVHTTIDDDDDGKKATKCKK